MKTNKIQSIAAFYNVETEEIDNTYDNVFEFHNEEYLVLTHQEQQEALHTVISDLVWAFNPDFLSDQTNLDPSVFIALQPKCEGANEAILHLIESTCGLTSFIEEATHYDSAGHFLAPYDGDEIELNNNLFAYRRN